MKSELCQPGNKNQVWDRIRPPNAGLGGYFFKNRDSKLCLDISATNTSKGLIVNTCDEKSDDQRFLFEYQIVKA